LTATFRSASTLPEAAGDIEVVVEFEGQAAVFAPRFNSTPKRHAALVFLLAAGFDVGGL
jgi:hypothetical protein